MERRRLLLAGMAGGVLAGCGGLRSGGACISGIDLLLDTISTMGGAIAREQLKEADVVIRPAIQSLAATHFQQRHEAILEGEKAAQAALPAIRERLAKLERG